MIEIVMTELHMIRKISNQQIPWNLTKKYAFSDHGCDRSNILESSPKQDSRFNDKQTFQIKMEKRRS